MKYKKQLDSIEYSDVLALRNKRESHILKLERMPSLTIERADEYVQIIKDWLQDDLGYSSDRVDSCECRRRDGFIPHSYNLGGLQARAYRDQYSACESTGFEETDKALTRAYDYDLEYYVEENEGRKPETEDALEAFDEYRRDSEDTIEFQARVLFTSETTANVDFYVSASDSPYHRKSDDRLEIEIEFKSPAGLKRKLRSLLKRDFVQCLITNIREAW